MSYQATMTDVEARPTAVVPATTTWQEFPTLWRELSDEVWACLHAGGISRGCAGSPEAAALSCCIGTMCHMSRLVSSCSSRARSPDE